MATKTDTDQLLRNLNKLEERSRLERLKDMVRGFFIPMDKVQNAREGYGDVTLGDRKLTYSELHTIMRAAECPCGHCRYYTLELFENGEWRIHHHAHGQVGSGKIKL